MARVTVEDCLENVDSRFTLVHLAVRRVLQLRHGVAPSLENVKGNKEVVQALREIAAGTINAENIRQIEEVALPGPEQATPPAAQAEAERADLQEILDEVSMFGASVEFESSEGFHEEDQPADNPQGE
jgi:DNA-directed RNA polymerase subunit omega